MACNGSLAGKGRKAGVVINKLARPAKVELAIFGSVDTETVPNSFSGTHYKHYIWKTLRVPMRFSYSDGKVV